ncbi:hypothetical protein EVAR_37993_1 [Eumeta japonica]|uniref:Uncharacterized protein n=1 Tax=Eumeta variegata TaxID=151549 RepID=A0A4C1WYG5_EUMVA|nr:hypothetical protein EVAR_37993_1 [Eumeta japonica]
MLRKAHVAAAASLGAPAAAPEGARSPARISTGRGARERALARCVTSPILHHRLPASSPPLPTPPADLSVLANLLTHIGRTRRRRPPSRPVRNAYAF